MLLHQLKFNELGQERKYKLNKKKRLKIIDSNSWLENNCKNQWIYRDYKCYYIVISKFAENQYAVSCSGASAGTYPALEQAKVAAFEFCDKIVS